MGSDQPQQVPSSSLCPPPSAQRPCILLHGKDWGQLHHGLPLTLPIPLLCVPTLTIITLFSGDGVVFLLFRIKCFPYDLNLVCVYLLTILFYQSFSLSCIFMPAFLKNKKERAKAQLYTNYPTSLSIYSQVPRITYPTISPCTDPSIYYNEAAAFILPWDKDPLLINPVSLFWTNFLGCSMASNPLTTLLSWKLSWPQYYQFAPSPSLTEGPASLVFFLFLCYLLHGDISRDSIFVPCILFSFFLSFFLSSFGCVVQHVGS